MGEGGSAGEGVRLEEAPGSGLLLCEAWVRGGIVAAEEAVVLCDLPVRDENVPGAGKAVVGLQRRACSGSHSSSFSVGRLVGTYTRMGGDPQQDHGVRGWFSG